MGAAMAKYYLGKGWRGALISRSVERMEKQVIGEKYSKQAIAIGMDLRKSESIEKGITQALEFLGGKLDLLVNNAGGTGMHAQTAETATLEDFNNVIALNVAAPFLITKFSIPALKKSKVRSLFSPPFF